MKDLETKCSPTKKKSHRLPEGGEQKEDAFRRLVGMYGMEYQMTLGYLALFQFL